MFIGEYAGDSMNQGEVSFLGSRTAEEAWPKIRKLFIEERYTQRGVARRLGVHYLTVWRWLNKNPAYRTELERLRKDALSEGL